MRGIPVLLATWLLVVGCICISCTTNEAPSTRVQTAGNDSPATANVNTGSGGAAGSAPCAAVGNKSQGNVGNPAGSSSACPDSHDTNSVPLAEDVRKALGLERAWVTQ